MDQVEDSGIFIQESAEDFKSFDAFLEKELTNKDDNNIFDDNDYSGSDEDDNFDFNVFSTNLDEEAHNFVDQPTCSNIFYPKIKVLERELFQNRDLPRFKDILRNCLKFELQQEDRLKVFGVSPPQASTSSQPMDLCNDTSALRNEKRPQCYSPDLFSSCSSEDEQEDFQISENTPNPEITEGVEAKSSSKANLIADAEKFMIKLLQDLVENGTACISVVNRTKWENSEVSNGILTQKDHSQIKFRNVNSKNPKSRRHFAMIMYVLSEVYHLLVTGSTCTERELYYKDPELVGKQTLLHSAIKDVCSILNTSPWELGIRQSSKGLICGAIKIHMSDNSVIDCYFNDRATLIPNDIQAITFLETTAKFVLIVEKDTIFQKCILQNILVNLNADIILLTGKGYPDLGTRLMVKRIWNDFQLPIYALVDADPFGIEIMFVYRYGSKAMAFSADQLACPQIRWIGIQPSEIEALAIPTTVQTKKDKKKIIELLQRTYINAEIRNELEILHRLGHKAEIEAVASFSANFLVYDYILNKIERNLVI